MTSENLWRAALHDFNNLMAGLQGVLDLTDPQAPLDGRNRLRLESVLIDGKLLVAMARALALGQVPESSLVPREDWQTGLTERLRPMCNLFRCPVELVDLGPEGSPWPAPLLLDWAAAFTRQILPWSAPGPLRLELEATPEAWTLTWVGDAPLPAALQPEPTPDAPMNLPSCWLRAMREPLGLTLEETPRGLRARVSRPGPL